MPRAKGYVHRPLAERFADKWALDEATGCHVWTGCRQSGGYGLIRPGGRELPPVLAHRVAYELGIGPIPDGLEPDHLCRNRACVNPAHLELVTHAENCKRGARWNHELAA